MLLHQLHFNYIFKRERPLEAHHSKICAYHITLKPIVLKKLTRFSVSLPLQRNFFHIERGNFKTDKKRFKMFLMTDPSSPTDPE